MELARLTSRDTAVQAQQQNFTSGWFSKYATSCSEADICGLLLATAMTQPPNRWLELLDPVVMRPYGTSLVSLWIKARIRF